MKRRDFIKNTLLTSFALAIPSFASSENKYKALANSISKANTSPEFKKLVFDLLKDWCDGMINVLVVDPANTKLHGMLKCPACDVVHGRSMDAVYPFLYMAKATGEKKYLDAGIAVFEWADNVSLPNGSWTNTLDPKSWTGTTIFGAIAVAEALHFHGDLLDNDRRQKWMDRLSKAAEYIYKNFTLTFTNINYGGTAVYGLNLFGRVLNNPAYIERSKELAKEIKGYFTQPNNLLFGEIKPNANVISPKGLHGVDLGYNVEETLNSLIMYALHEKDEAFLHLLTKSLNSHLEFMLPDGGWDNSWGTRMYKWTYWGSRTCDGSQPAYAMMAHRNPAFGTAAIKNTELLKKCTANGLLYGGSHYLTHNLKACVHHTFAHAKPLASLLDNWEHLAPVNTEIPLPRAVADGVTHFDELDTTLFARGDWRGTITAYDANYYHDKYRQATGGAMSVLYHNKVGLLLTASMAVYKLIEENNQQPAPGEDIALTPRIETYKNNAWFTNLFDLTATIKSSDKAGEIKTVAQTQLKNEKFELVEGTASAFEISYQCTEKKIKISASTNQNIVEKTSFMLPIVSPTGEEVKQVNAKEITIKKPNGLVRIKANVTLRIKDMPKSRTFNMVPGVEAVPIIAYFPKGKKSIEISIEVV